ncbi:hypothetical protein CRUP_001596 [Coryphaenoides rupestris]|nr:hypothetical protein CRUP_001596 [Coryphaenoides rupestris]
MSSTTTSTSLPLTSPSAPIRPRPETRNVTTRSQLSKDGVIPHLVGTRNSIDAIPSADQVRITPSLRSQRGSVWTKNIVSFDSWEAVVTFRVSGRGRMGADGLKNNPAIVVFIAYAIPSADQVRITPSLRSQRGSVWTKNIVSFDSWEAVVTFRVSGRGRMGADGLVSGREVEVVVEDICCGLQAVWFTSEQGLEGPVYGAADNVQPEGDAAVGLRQVRPLEAVLVLEAPVGSVRGRRGARRDVLTADAVTDTGLQR